MSAAGSLLFARYAYAPNDLGYCGPAQARELFEVASASGAAGPPPDLDVTPVARTFSGAWPYLHLLAQLAGVPDPLDEDVVRAYWTGGPLLRTIDAAEFGERLLAYLGPQAGHYWQHLTPALLPEALPSHGFHVMGVYPWSRLLHQEPSSVPLSVIENCRIRWGQVEQVQADTLTVSVPQLTWDGAQLTLAAPASQDIRYRDADGATFCPDPQVGEWVSGHWDWVCERLTEAQVQELQESTHRQIEVTNQRLKAS